MKKTLIVADHEFARLLRRGWVLASAAAMALLGLALAATRAASGLAPGFSGGYGTSLSSLVLLLSSLSGVLVAALSFAEDEGGGMADLVRSFGLGDRRFLLGKYAGILAAIAGAATAGLLASFAVSGLAGIVPLRGGSGEIKALAMLAATGVAASAVYAAWGAFFGSASRNVLGAAGSALAFWFVTLFLYEVIGWILFPALPYRIANPALAMFLALDPAEALRLGSLFLGGNGASLGPEFYRWQLFFLGLPGIVAAIAILAAHLALPLTLAARRNRRAVR
jgi:ABC-type transport system involved in multi-copper enzyme maturation permease subunit